MLTVEGPTPEYATVVNVTPRNTDVILTFRLAMPEQEATPNDAPPVALVILPWALVKGLVPMLTEVVVAYEGEAGPVIAPNFTGGPGD